MIANLPLLFVNGNPAALTKISGADLDRFISFMVTCSWGHDTARGVVVRPPWWSREVPFTHPYARPDAAPKNWDIRLRTLVKKCYNYHNSTFLLVFSAQLSRYPRKRLRYVDNRDHTTSLYYRPNGRLLVTFRNENMHYDDDVAVVELDSEPEVKPDSESEEKPDSEPEVKPTDIYLCDNCDSHFDNFDILTVHERLCNNENVPKSACIGGLPEFLSALKLLPVGEKLQESASVDSNDSRPRNARTTANIDRGPPYPFSSLAYIRNSKVNAQRDTSYSRERIERYCCTSTPISKNLASKGKTQQFPVRYRRPIDYWNRKQVFPNQRNKKILDIKGQLYLLKCRPITVDVDRMSIESMQAYIDNLREEAERKAEEDKDVVYVDGLDCDQPEDVEMKDPLKRQEECEVIDLCSDDESSVVSENCDPRAGVACVMRGGAVLRRTAATPQALPAEPSGARQRPLPSAILHPHPVILIAHTLNNLQTISLE